MQTPETINDTPTKPPARRGRWIAGVSLIVAGIVGLGAWAIASPGAVSYFVTPSEVASGHNVNQASLRLGGRVAVGTLHRDGSIVEFSVTDGTHQVPVRYAGEVPDTLKEKTDVVAEGVMGPDGTFAATRVMAKCSSKFVPEVESKARANRTG